MEATGVAALAGASSEPFVTEILIVRSSITTVVVDVACSVVVVVVVDFGGGCEWGDCNEGCGAGGRMGVDDSMVWSGDSVTLLPWTASVCGDSDEDDAGGAGGADGSRVDGAMFDVSAGAVEESSCGDVRSLFELLEMECSRGGNMFCG